MKPAILFLEPKGTALEVVRTCVERGFATVIITSDDSMLRHTPFPYISALELTDAVLTIESWNSEQEVIYMIGELEHKFKFMGVYYAMDPCAVVASKLRLQFGLPASTPEVMKTILNKSELRRELRRLGFSHLENLRDNEIENIKTWPFKGAAYFKPVHGLASAYVKRCVDLRDLSIAMAEFANGSSSDPVALTKFVSDGAGFHLEQEFKGELISVEGVSFKGKFHCIGLLSRILYSKNHVVEMGSCFPYPHQYEKEITRFVEAALGALGFTDGPTHTELIISDSGEFEIIDLNPRFVGADVLQSINFAFGIKFQDVLADYAIGLEPKWVNEQGKFSCLQYVLPPKIEIFESIEFPESHGVVFTSQFTKKGVQIFSNDKQLDYLGCYLTVASSFNEAIAESNRLRSQVRINGAFQGEY